MNRPLTSTEQSRPGRPPKLFQKGQSSFSPSKKRDAITAVAFLAPSFLGTAAFILVPFMDAVRRSFFSSMGGHFRGLAGYQTIFSNTAFQLAAANTGKFLLVCIPLLLILSLSLALLVFYTVDRSGFIKTSFLLPLAIPAASIVMLWQILFDKQGVLNSFLGLHIDWLHSGSAFWVLVFTYLWKNCGYNMVLWLSGLYSISPALYEAAMVDGAGKLQKFWYITLPGLRPYVFTVASLSLLNSFKVFREAYLLGGNYPHESIYLLQHLFNNWFTSLDIDKLCAAATVMAAALFAVIVMLSRLPTGEESQ